MSSPSILYDKPLDKISYNVRAADKSVISIAGYVHRLYLNLDGKDYLFEAGTGTGNFRGGEFIPRAGGKNFWGVNWILQHF